MAVGTTALAPEGLGAEGLSPCRAWLLVWPAPIGLRNRAGRQGRMSRLQRRDRQLPGVRPSAKSPDVWLMKPNGRCHPPTHHWDLPELRPGRRGEPRLPGHS